MKTLFTWVIRIAVLVVLVKIVLWSWEQYQLGGVANEDGETDDFYKQCRITNPDTGSCVCIHRETRERLKIPYDECVRRARDPNAR